MDPIWSRCNLGMKKFLVVGAILLVSALASVSQQTSDLKYDANGNILPTTVNGKPLNLPAGTTVGGTTIGGGGGNAQTNANLDQFADVTQTIGAILNITGATTLPQTTVSGNAGSATKLATPRAINGVPFDGTAAITVPAAGSTLTDPVLPVNGALPAFGAVGQVLVKSGTANYAAGWQTVAGSGDVSAAAPFGTDNRLVRSDGVAKGVQGSAVTLDDAGNLSGIATATSSDLSTSTFTILDDINHNFGLEIHEGTAFTSNHKLIFIGNTADVTFNFTASTNLTFPTSGTLLSSGGPGTFTGLSTSSYLQLTGIVTPTALAGPVNDYNPGFPAVIARIDPAGTGRSISGLLAQPNGTILEIQNISTTGTRVLTLADNNSGSVAANRFSFGGSDIVLNGGQSMVVWYDGASAAWRPFGRGVGSIATAGTYGDATHVPQFTLGVDGRIIGTPALVAVAGGGGGGTPAGSTNQLQYNNAGAFGATASLSIDPTKGQFIPTPVAGGAAGAYPSYSFSDNPTIGLAEAGGWGAGIGFDVGASVPLASYAWGSVATVLTFTNNTTNATTGSVDVGLQHNATAGTLEVNNGTLGTYADLKVRNLTATGTIAGGAPAKIVWITTVGSGTFTTPASCRALYVEVVGGGGGSAGALGTGSSAAVAGGGGGGSFAAKYYATPAVSYAYTVGAGGTAGTATPTAGGTGGDTTFGTTTPLTGSGAGGSAIPTAGTTAAVSGNCGYALGSLATSNGDVFIWGSNGALGIRYGGAAGAPGGYGGASMFAGAGGTGVSVNSAGFAGQPYGGGAAGATSANATGQVGAKGGDGAIKITEYF